MLIDLALKGSKVLVIGAGRVGMRKAKSVLAEQGAVTILSARFSTGAKRLKSAGARLVKGDAGDESVLRPLLLESDLVIVATNNHPLNHRIARLARTMGKKIGTVDDPSESDFNFPAVRSVGDIRVGVATGGRSPAMARLICEKLARSITREDRLRVELMKHARDSAKDKLPTPAARRSAMYRVLNDEKVATLVRAGRLVEAKAAAEAVIGGS